MPEEEFQGEDEDLEEAEQEEDAEGSGPEGDDRLVVEGILFSSDRPLQIVDIEGASGLPRVKVRKALRRLASDYRRRNTALEVVKVGSRWTMQVRREFTPSARTVATPEVDPRLLRTLALIAYHQPVLQSDLQEMLGPKVYDHVRELSDLGLVTARRKGPTKELTTTQRFPEYFGIASAKREDIKRFLASQAGIELPPEPVEGTDETPQEGTGEGPAGEGPAGEAVDEGEKEEAPAGEAPPPDGEGM